MCLTLSDGGKKKNDLPFSSRISHIAMQTEDWSSLWGAKNMGMFKMLGKSKSSVLVINMQIIVDKESIQTETDSRMHSLERTKEKVIPQSSCRQIRRGMLLASQ